MQAPPVEFVDVTSARLVNRRHMKHRMRLGLDPCADPAGGILFAGEANNEKADVLRAQLLKRADINGEPKRATGRPPFFAQ